MPRWAIDPQGIQDSEEYIGDFGSTGGGRAGKLRVLGIREVEDGGQRARRSVILNERAIDVAYTSYLHNLKRSTI